MSGASRILSGACGMYLVVFFTDDGTLAWNLNLIFVAQSSIYYEGCYTNKPTLQ